MPESSSLQLLGRGGYSVVNRVVHHRTGHVFARKTMPNTRDVQAQFANELRAFNLMWHQHIIRLIGPYT
jgi:serine/threonine protein kinase